MRCTRPLKASFNSSGSVTYSSKEAISGLVPFEIECRKCLPCRLNNAREKAIRAVHEAKMHEDNIFLTLTYADEHLESPRLIYSHWQTFIKDLRNHVYYKSLGQQKISTMVTGEYGDKNKRPHWHALIFNFRPSDAVLDQTNDRGDRTYTSELITSLWNRGRCNFGEVTLESAGYTARYAAKKLVHGNDEDHNYHPIHRTSSKYGIGRSWIEKYYKETFLNGYVVVNSVPTKIPRYYVDWAKKHKPDIWAHYVTEVRPKIQAKAEASAIKDEMSFISDVINRRTGTPFPLTRSKVKETILKSKFKTLQERLKL